MDRKELCVVDEVGCIIMGSTLRVGRTLTLGFLIASDFSGIHGRVVHEASTRNA